MDESLLVFLILDYFPFGGDSSDKKCRVPSGRLAGNRCNWICTRRSEGTFCAFVQMATDELFLRNNWFLKILVIETYIYTAKEPKDLRHVMKKVFLSAFLCASIFSRCQSNSDSTIYITVKQSNMKKFVDFIKQVKQQELSDTNFLLAEEPFLIDSLDCLNKLSAEVSLLTQGDLRDIKTTKYPFVYRWTKESFGNIKTVNRDTIDRIFKDDIAFPRDDSKGWGYFYRNFGDNLNRFSLPVFFKNDTYCLFYSSVECGWLCGGGSLTLYKKIGEKWVKVKSYCEWIS